MIDQGKVETEDAVKCDEMKEMMNEKKRVNRCCDDVWGSKPKGGGNIR